MTKVGTPQGAVMTPRTQKISLNLAGLFHIDMKMVLDWMSYKVIWI
jgi:hypothetical protein